MNREFEIDAYRKGRELYLVLRGRLILSYCQEAKTRLVGLMNTQVEQVYVHLAGLNFLDSAGLGVLVGLKMTANKNRIRLVMLAPAPRVEDIFRVSKLDSIFEIQGGVEADLVRASLQREEYCLWRDCRDLQQKLFNTDSDALHTVRSGLTSLIPESEDEETAAKVKQLCADAVEYIKLGDYRKALAAYERVLSLEPDNLSALNNMGVVYEKQPEWYGQAIGVWKKVLDLSMGKGDEKHAARARKHLESLSKLVR